MSVRNPLNDRGSRIHPFPLDLASHFGLGGFLHASIDPGLIGSEADARVELIDRFLGLLAARAISTPRIVARRPQVGPRMSVPLDEPGIGSEADLATCVDCLVELFDPTDRRSGDPFIACGSCGPRWSSADSAVLDRSNAGRPACPKCLADFVNPANRRFLAEGIACPECGPRLRVEGLEPSDLGPIAAAVEALIAGKIGALKGLGGYHLACDATSPLAVARLRGRKRTGGRPLAIMVANLAAARAFCEIDEAEAALLNSPARPIVILKRLSGPSKLADGVAGESPWLGVMLPDSAMHHLILQELQGVPLVMTGGESSGEPIAFEPLGARKWLKMVADFFLEHDRPILIRSDDSVARVVAGGETTLRRSRGQAPQPVPLVRECPVPILAVGSQRQAAFTLGQGRQAVLSHHLSDLRNIEAFRAFGEAADHFEARLGVSPELVAHDFDPTDASTFHATRRGVETLPVQHHHAHVASCMAENGLDEPVIGVVLDDEALGGDGSLWGGEFLVADYEGFRRAGQFRSVAMPGREAAIRHPWRMALAYLDDARESLDLLSDRVSLPERRKVEACLKRKIDAPGTSSVARLFDAVAVLAGLRRDLGYEGQGADELEWRSSEVEPDHAYPFDLATAEDRPRLIIDTRPMIEAIADDVRQGIDAARIGRRFHSTLVEAIVRVCGLIRLRDGLNVVALTGSVFVNKLLLEETIDRLTRDGFEVHHHRQVPTHDGGISLGQTAIAAAWLARREEAARFSESNVIA